MLIKNYKEYSYIKKNVLAILISNHSPNLQYVSIKIITFAKIAFLKNSSEKYNVLIKKIILISKSQYQIYNFF